LYPKDNTFLLTPIVCK